MRSAVYEQCLNKFGIPFEYVEGIELDQINHTRGKQMQARLDPLDHGLIDNYMKMLEDGFEPPPLLLWKPGRGMYVPLDGNQRIAAMQQVAKRHQKPFCGYVISTDDQMVVDRVCWQFNNMVNGRRLSYEESLEHALTFVRKYNQPIDQTAKEWGVKAWELKAKTRDAELRELAGRNRIDVSHVPLFTLLELNPLKTIGEDLCVKAIKVTAESGVGQKEAKRLAKDVSHARTLGDKLKVLEEFESADYVQKIKAETKGGKVRTRYKRKPSELLQRHLDHVENLMDDYQDAAFKPVGKEDGERYRATALKVANRLIKIYGLGAALHGQGVAV